MKCSKCGAELIKDAKFCSICGTKINYQIKSLEDDVVKSTDNSSQNSSSNIKSQKPAKQAEVKADKTGAEKTRAKNATEKKTTVKKAASESKKTSMEKKTGTKKTTAEKTKAKTSTEKKTGTKKNTDEKTNIDSSTTKENISKKNISEKAKSEIIEVWEKISLYGRFTIVMIIVSLLLFLAAYYADKIWSEILAILSFLFIVGALLIKRDIIHIQKKWMYKVAILLAVVLVVPYYATLRVNYDDNHDNREEKIKNVNISKGVEGETSSLDYIISYYDTSNLEKALDAGEKVNGKIIQFSVTESKNESGSNTCCESGKPFSFVTKKELDIGKVGCIVGRIESEPTKKDGVWTVSYEVLAVGEKNQLIEYAVSQEKDTQQESVTQQEPTVQPETTTQQETTTHQETTVEETTTSKPDTRITMTADSSSYIGKQRKDVEKELKDKGFTNIKIHKIKTTSTNNSGGKVASVLVKNKSFKKGDKFKKNVKIVINCWKYVKPKPQSEYEKAYVRRLSLYDLYYMFDTDNKKVVYFGYGDMYPDVDKGTYSGDLATGVTIYWDHGQFTDKFTHSSGNQAILTDANGWEWEFYVCDVAEAQKILDEIQK